MKNLEYSAVGWWEEYRCGCISNTVRTKKELLGYCPKHGDDFRHQHKDYKVKNSPKGQI